MVSLERLEKCRILGILGIAWASLSSEAILWAKVDPNALKYLMSEVQEVGLAVG